MAKYRVIVPYWFTLSAIVEAENEEEAMEKFNLVPTDECKEGYQGILDSYDIEIEEIED